MSNPTPPGDSPRRIEERRIVQIAGADGGVYALCSDGTLWHATPRWANGGGFPSSRIEYVWQQVEAIP